MSLRSDFYALPLLHRIGILIASMGFAFLCGAVANLYQESGVVVAAAGGCGGVLLYHIAARIAVTVFMVGAVKTLKPSADERARKKKETASRHAAAFTRAQLARARTLMAKQGTREGERRDAGAQPSQSSAGPRATHAGWTREKPAPAHLRPASGPLTAVDARTPQHRTARPSADLDDGAAPRCSARRLDLDAGEHVGREQRASPRSLSALDQRTGERTAHHGLADAAHAHYTARLDLGRRPVAEKPAWLRAMELGRSSGLWCSRMHILSRFGTYHRRRPAGIASVWVAERGGRDGEVVSSHTLMYRSGSEGRNGEGR